MKARIEIPKGWRRVTRGERRRGDLVFYWAPSVGAEWNETCCPGLRIPERPGLDDIVIRRISPSGKKQQGKTAKKGTKR